MVRKEEMKGCQPVIMLSADSLFMYLLITEPCDNIVVNFK